MNTRQFAIVGLAVVLTTSAAHATTVGYNTPAAYWARGDTNTAFATFDTFTATEGSVATADSSSELTAIDFTQSSEFISGFIPPDSFNPAGLYASGDRIYVHDNAVNFTVTGTTAFHAKTVMVQIKQFQSALYSFNAPTLNGLDADFSSTKVVSEAGNDNSVTTFAWFDALTGESITNLSLNLTNGPFVFFQSIDGLQIDVSDQYFEVTSVPAPATAGLVISAGALALTRRRPSKRRTI